MGKSSTKGRPTGRQAKVAAAQRARGSGPNRIAVAAVVVVVAIVAVVAGVILANRSATPSGGSDVPVGAAGMGQGVVASHDQQREAGAPTVDVYEDFQCPHCATFERALGATLQDQAVLGKIKLVYHPMTFLDANLRNDASARAAEGALCAAESGGFLGFHNAVFANEPQQEGAGWTDQQLEGFAADAGLTSVQLTAWRGCTAGGRFADYLASIERSSSQDGVTETPTVRVDGTTLTADELASSTALLSAIAAHGS